MYFCFMASYSFTPFPELLTERLVLRKLTLDDAPEIYYLRSDEAVLEHICRHPAESIEAAKEWIMTIQSNIEKGESILWAISFTSKPGELIGTICLWNLQPENFRGEIGYALSPEHWGNGIMKEALDAVVDYGFRKMNLHSIEARVNATNKASASLLEKSSFTKDAYFKEDIFFNGRFMDTMVYSRLATQI